MKTTLAEPSVAANTFEKVKANGIFLPTRSLWVTRAGYGYHRIIVHEYVITIVRRSAVRLFFETDRKSKAKTLFTNPGNSKIKTFAIFTAENPDAKELSNKDNTFLNKGLKSDLKDLMTNALNRGRFHYYKVKGKYGAKENSFLVYNLSVSDAKDLCEKFKQESFVFGLNKEGELVFQFWRNASKGNGYNYIKVDEKSVFEDSTNEEDNYTQISRDFKFTIPFSIFESTSKSVEEFYNSHAKEYLKHSLDLIECLDIVTDDSYTSRHRYETRMLIFGSNPQ